MQIHLIAAARPNFMKIAPLCHALREASWCDARIVHTGQHYDASMSDAFFADLQLPEPVQESVDRELKRARRVPEQSAERTVAVDWLGSKITSGSSTRPTMTVSTDSCSESSITSKLTIALELV